MMIQVSEFVFIDPQSVGFINTKDENSVSILVDGAWLSLNKKEFAKLKPYTIPEKSETLEKARKVLSKMEEE